jgi:hypothetical protein
MSGVNISCQLLSGGTSQKLSLTSSSVQSAILTSSAYLLTVDTDCFGRTGVNPTAVSDGTDQVFLAGNTYRIVPIVIGNKIALITSGASGFAYLTPDA